MYIQMFLNVYEMGWKSGRTEVILFSSDDECPTIWNKYKYNNNNNIYLKSNIQWTYNDIHNNHVRYTL